MWFALLFLPASAVRAQTQARATAEEAIQPGSAAVPTAEKPELKTYTLPPEKYELAVAYSRARYRLHFLGVLYGLAILLGILTLRVAPRFRSMAEAASGRRFVQVVIFAPLLFLTFDVLDLPLDIYRQYLALHYDQSVQSWGSWIWDWTKGELIGLLIGTFLIWILYGVIRRSPRRWWFYFWLAAVPILIFIVFLAPYVIDPLFFKFEPLQAKQPALVQEIGKVMARAGLSIPRERMFEMNASEKYKSVNAYVTGIGASKRVVVWDTTIQKTTVPQTLFVFGHEMGHYVLLHIPRTIAVLAVLLLVLLYLGYRGMHWALRRWGERWTIRRVDDWASLPVFLLFFSLFGFLAEPIISTYSRWQEHQADIYGLEVTHGIVPESNRVAAGAFQILGEINLSDPNPNAFVKFWLYDHPPLAERLVFAREYDPWSEGRPARYVP
jgi:Zn-dependent protease with chaperone function